MAYGRGIAFLGMFVLGACCGAVLTLYFLPKPFHQANIIFPNKQSFDAARFGSDNFIVLNGTLTGEGLRHENKAVQIACYRDAMRCFIFHIVQIGDYPLYQLGDLDLPIALSISRWEPNLVVATADDDSLSSYPNGCIKSTLDLVRNNGNVDGELIEEPINSTEPICKNTPSSTRKWSVESPSYWGRSSRK